MLNYTSLQQSKVIRFKSEEQNRLFAVKIHQRCHIRDRVSVQIN